jgi:hypothetical protein
VKWQQPQAAEHNRYARSRRVGLAGHGPGRGRRDVTFESRTFKFKFRKRRAGSQAACCHCTSTVRLLHVRRPVQTLAAVTVRPAATGTLRCCLRVPSHCMNPKVGDLRTCSVAEARRNAPNRRPESPTCSSPSWAGLPLAVPGGACFKYAKVRGWDSFVVATPCSALCRSAIKGRRVYAGRMLEFCGSSEE